MSFRQCRYIPARYSHGGVGGISGRVTSAERDGTDVDTGADLIERGIERAEEFKRSYAEMAEGVDGEEAGENSRVFGRVVDRFMSPYKRKAKSRSSRSGVP